jgi:23S rRNA pseudouridine1911/1915/1917 synthase
MPSLQVLYEDNHLLIVIKPPNLLSQGDSTGDDSLVEIAKAYIKEKYAKPGEVFLGLPHRLDRPVAGVMVLARTSKALTRLNEQFKQRTIEKIYTALVEGQAADREGELVHYLLKDPKTNITKAYEKPRGEAKKAILRYEWLQSKGGYSLLRIYPETGRPHQIRVQLAAMGCPIVGDVKYGAKHSKEVSGIALYASSLRFIHPVKKIPLRFDAPEPEWLKAFNKG